MNLLRNLSLSSTLAIAAHVLSTHTVWAQAAPAPAGPAPAEGEAQPAAPAEPPAVAQPAPSLEAAPSEPSKGELPPQLSVPVTAPTAVAAKPPPAVLDYSDGSFYLRSVDDNIVLVPGARMHIDTYSFAGPHVSDYQRGNGTGLKTNLFFRRFVLEMGGLIRRDWFFWLGGNFAPTSVDANQNSFSTANVYDGFIGYKPNDNLRFYAGQFNEAFTMENVTSSRWFDFMERALIIRTVATPYNKADGFLAWGQTSNKSFEYQLGVVGGDGMNRPNVDNRVDGTVRLVYRPLADQEGALKNLHVGAGARYGSRDPDYVFYDAPSLSTPGGYAFWSPVYGTAPSVVHIIPSREQFAASGELYLPFERFDVRGEVVYVNEGRREALETDKSETLRAGTLKGVGGYGQFSYWVSGTPRINGNPAGVYGITKLPKDLGAQNPYGLQIALRLEFLRLAYDSTSHRGSTPGRVDASTNDISVNAYQAVVNYWATKHVRLTAEYSLYQFPGSPGENQALAPGAKKNGSDPEANLLHEISFRLGLAL